MARRLSTESTATPSRRSARRPLWKRACASAVIATALSAQPALAHNDGDAGPNLSVSAYVGQGTTPNRDAGKRTWRLHVTFDHDVHGKREIVAAGFTTDGTKKLPFGDPSVTAQPGEYEVMWTDEPGWRDFGSKDLSWIHGDCSPRNPLLVRADLVEIHTNEAIANLIDLFTTANTGMGYTWWIAKRTGFANVGYGAGMAVVPDNGTVSLALRSKLGVTSIPVIGQSVPDPEGQNCAGISEDEERAILGPSEATALAMDPIIDGFRDYQALVGENPPIGDDEEAHHRATQNALVGLARLRAARAIGSVQSNYTDDAVAAYRAGVELAKSGRYAEALAAYRSAFYDATAGRHEAALEGYQLPFGNQMPTEIIATSDYVAVSRGSEFELRAEVSGRWLDESVTDVELTGELEAAIVPGLKRYGVALSADLAADLPAGNLVGLDRIGGASLTESERCGLMLDAEDWTSGYSIDGRGPYYATGECGIGRVYSTTQWLPGGRAIDSLFEGGAFGVAIDPTGVAPGEYAMTLRATLRNQRDPSGARQVELPITVRIIDTDDAQGIIPPIGGAEERQTGSNDDELFGCQVGGTSTGFFGLLLAALGLACCRRRRRPRPRKPLWQRATAASALLALLAQPALAHNDGDSGENLTVAAYVGNGTAPDDEAGMDEWDLTVVFDHGVHGSREIFAQGVSLSGSTSLPFGDPHVYEYSNASLFEVKKISDYDGPRDAREMRWVHDDCSPRQDLIVWAELVENDVDAFGDGLVDLLIMPSMVLGVVWWSAQQFRGNENYGSDLALVPANGTATLSLNGVNGVSTIPIIGETQSNPGGQKCPAITEEEKALILGPDERTAMLMEPILDAFGSVELAARESDNPDGMSEADVAAYKKTAALALVGTARILAAREIGDVYGTYTEEAIAAYTAAGEMAAAGEYRRALEYYQAAIYNAAATRKEADLEGYPLEIGNSMPTEVHMVSSYLSVNPGSSFELRGEVGGLAESESIVALTAATELGASVLPGFARQGVALAEGVGEQLPANRIIGLDRIEGAHVTETECGLVLAAEDGFYVDGEGPLYAEGPCGIGKVVTTELFMAGGRPTEVGFESGRFGLALDTTGAQPGEYVVTVAATIAGPEGQRHVELPLTVRIAEPMDDGVAADDGGVVPPVGGGSEEPQSVDQPMFGCSAGGKTSPGSWLVALFGLGLGLVCRRRRRR